VRNPLLDGVLLDSGHDMKEGLGIAEIVIPERSQRDDDDR
jgi:hypothetical protein